MLDLIYDVYNKRWKFDGISGTITASCGSSTACGCMYVIDERKMMAAKKQETRQYGVDLCFIETRLVDVSACICVRYDAGICRHKMEHTGVLVEYKQ